MTPKYAPVTAEEFEALMTKLRPQMDADNWHKAETALATLKERGMPDASTFSLDRIVGDDEADVNLKMHLATAPAIKAWSDGQISMDDMEEAVSPLMYALLDIATEKGGAMLSGGDATISYPVTIEVAKQAA